ncbi:MAG TPA: ABC transporter ATP-binding protein [Candidatus Saccharimonadales bacterium]
MDNALNILKYYYKHLKKFKVLAIGTLTLLPIITLVANYIPPLILAVVLNRLSIHDYVKHQVWHSFGSLIVLYGVVILFSSMVLWRIFDYFYWRLEGNMERSIAQDVFQHLVGQSTDFHANEFAGSLVSRNSKVLSAYIRITDTTLFQVMPLFFGVIFVSIIMWSRSSGYVVVLLIGSLFYVISSFTVTKKIRHLGAKTAASESDQTGMLADALGNISAIKSFSGDNYENSRFKKVTNKTYSWLIKMYWAFQYQQLFFSGAAGILTIASLVVAIVSVVTFNANLATAFLIFNYTAGIIQQLFTFSNNSLRSYSRAFGDATEMVAIMGVETDVKDPVKPEKLAVNGGSIEFKNVSFTHNGSDDNIFKDFNLKIKEGEKIGLVGHSGAGKTTFTRLLMRFSDLDEGEILIGGQNIANVTQNDLHSLIAYVPQEPQLFHRTIRENIAYGDPSASDAKVVQAATQANANEFISMLQKKYYTLVGERGVKLSGGQRQRIAIARAVLKQAPVLLLDEATSALDSESEVLIQDALWKLMKGRTTIVIAHRLSTIQKMDRIIVLSDGQIIEQGSHKQLLEKSGTYAKLWAHQSGGFLED